MSRAPEQRTQPRRRGRRSTTEHEEAGSGAAVVPRHPRGPDDGRVTSPPHAGDPPHHPRGARKQARVEIPHAGEPGSEVHHHPRGAQPRRRRQVPVAGLPASRSHHDLADGGTPRQVPSADALWPYARALVALALEVRSEGLALPGVRRSHGPLGKGGGRCVA